MSLPCTCPACRDTLTIFRQGAVALLAMWAWVGPAVFVGVAAAADVVLTNAVQVRVLTPEEAAKALPVRLRGVVVCSDWSEFSLVDQTSGIYCGALAGRSWSPIATGTLVEVEGVTDPGDFAPFVRVSAVTTVGSGTIPTPQRVTYEDLLDGSWDAQWVEIEGVVREAIPAGDKREITLTTGGGELRILLTEEQGRLAGVDSKIRLRGSCFYQFNRARQAVRPVLRPGGSDPVVVLEAPPTDPYSLPSVPISSLTQFNPKGLGGHRVRVRGVVTHVESAGGFWISDSSQGIHVLGKQGRELHPGERVDVLGFVAREGGLPVLNNAVFRVLGKTNLPAAIRLESPADAQGHHGALVEMVGVIAERSLAQEGCRLRIIAGTQSFMAFWRNEDQRPVPKDWLAGARVRVTGVCIVNVGEAKPLPGILGPISFELLLRFPADVQVIEPAPWWTPTHTSWVLGVTLVASMVAGAAVFGGYRRRAVRRLSDLRARQALADERARIARDLHDDLGANLAQIGAVAGLADQYIGEPARLRPQIKRIYSTAHDLARQLDSVVWTVDPANDTLESLARYLHGHAEEYLSGAGIRCQFATAEAMPDIPLSSSIRHHILMFVKEALHNVVSHSGASLVVFSITATPRQLVLEIADNGRGLPDPALLQPGNGLANMKTRAESLGGHCDFTAPEAGSGLIVRLTAPLAPFLIKP